MYFAVCSTLYSLLYSLEEYSILILGIIVISKLFKQFTLQRSSSTSGSLPVDGTITHWGLNTIGLPRRFGMVDPNSRHLTAVCDIIDPLPEDTAGFGVDPFGALPPWPECSSNFEQKKSMRWVCYSMWSRSVHVGNDPCVRNKFNFPEVWNSLPAPLQGLPMCRISIFPMLVFIIDALIRRKNYNIIKLMANLSVMHIIISCKFGHACGLV